MSVDTRKIQPGNPAGTANQGGGQAVGLPQQTNLPAVPDTFADVAAVQAYLVQLVAALQP